MVNLEIYSDLYRENLKLSKYYNPKDKDLLELFSRLYTTNLTCEFNIHLIENTPHTMKQIGKDGSIIWVDLGTHETCTLTITTDRKVYDLINVSYKQVQRIILDVIEPSNDGDLFVGNGSHE